MMDIQIGLTGFVLLFAALLVGASACDAGCKRVERAAVWGLCTGLAMMIFAALVAIWTRLP